MVKPLVEDAVKQQVNDALFPRRDIERSALPVEVVPEPNRGSELECLAPKRTVNHIQTPQAASGKLVQGLAVGRDVQRLAPVKQRLCIHAHRGLVQFDLTIDVSPTKALGGFHSRHHALEWQQVTPKFCLV